jgi:tRNA-2-methylthio-N6-dimethylallyladenosine synthase
MNRKYAKETYLSLIREIRSHIPGAGITTDIIVGFPTETDAEFEETLDLVKQCQFDDAYMYAYSVRPGTKASNYDPLPESVVKQRLARLIKVQHQIILEKTRKMIGNTYEILIECPARDNAVRGKTSANKDIVVEKAIKPGSICRVKVNEVRGRTPVAKLSSQAISLK